MTILLIYLYYITLCERVGNRPYLKFVRKVENYFHQGVTLQQILSSLGQCSKTSLVQVSMPAFFTSSLSVELKQKMGKDETEYLMHSSFCACDLCLIPERAFGQVVRLLSFRLLSSPYNMWWLVFPWDKKVPQIGPKCRAGETGGTGPPRPDKC